MTSPSWRGLLFVLATMQAACAPTFDWRETRPTGTGLQLLFPCRPVHQERSLTLAGVPLRLQLLSCGAGAHTWGLAYADVGDPSRLDGILAALQASAAANAGASQPAATPQPVSGATPQPRSGRSRLVGRTPEGQPLAMQTLVFTRGTWVFQASALGATVQDEAADTFMASIRFPP